MLVLNLQVACSISPCASLLDLQHLCPVPSRTSSLQREAPGGTRSRRRPMWEAFPGLPTPRSALLRSSHGLHSSRFKASPNSNARRDPAGVARRACVSRDGLCAMSSTGSCIKEGGSCCGGESPPREAPVPPRWAAYSRRGRRWKVGCPCSLSRTPPAGLRRRCRRRRHPLHLPHPTRLPAFSRSGPPPPACCWHWELCCWLSAPHWWQRRWPSHTRAAVVAAQLHGRRPRPRLSLPASTQKACPSMPCQPTSSSRMSWPTAAHSCRTARRTLPRPPPLRRACWVLAPRPCRGQSCSVRWAACRRCCLAPSSGCWSARATRGHRLFRRPLPPRCEPSGPALAAAVLAVCVPERLGC